MDVRCESCQTLYEFDDARIKERGTTVKCTQCGHIFKVHKKPPGQRGPTTLPGLAPVLEGGTGNTPPLGTEDPTQPQGQVRRPSTTGVVNASGGSAASALPAGLSDSSPDRMWMLRSAASGEVRRFRDLTTLQQWIVELKAWRDDEISRNGDRWKRIGGIAELEPFFRVVEQARARTSDPGVPQRISPDGVAPSLYSTTPPTAAAPVHPPMLPPGYPATPPVGSEAAGPIPAYLPPPTPPPERPLSTSWRNGLETPLLAPPTSSDLPDDDELPRRGRLAVTAVAVASVAVLLGVTGYLAVYKRGALKSMVSADEGARGREALRKGREYFLLDTDDDFHHADQQFQRAQGADESNPQPVAALVELNSTWARHLREDARFAEALDPSRVADLKQRAQSRLDEARRYASEARSLGAGDPTVNRALADLAVLDGAPAAVVEEALKRAEIGHGEDPEVRYVRGALQARDGRIDEARALLDQADKLNQAATHHELLRALYLGAVLEARAGRAAEAKAMAQRILEANPHHLRAQALAAALDRGASLATTVAAPAGATAPVAPSITAAPAPTPAPAPAAAPVAAAPAATPPAAAAPAPAPAPPPVEREPRGYNALVDAGNQLLERGKGKEAVKMFQKALTEQPGGLEAQIGLAWAYLDYEHYGAAADKFKEVLAVMPNNGEAIIGLAETYKLRGDKPKALEWYQKYLEVLPRGSKARMAQQNVTELEADIARKERAERAERGERSDRPEAAPTVPSTPPSPSPPASNPVAPPAPKPAAAPQP